MEGLRGYLEALKSKKTEIESQDIEAFVQAKLLEIEPKIRAEAKAQQQVETQVLAIKIEAITDAIAVVEAEKLAETEAQAETETEEQTFQNT